MVVELYEISGKPRASEVVRVLTARCAVAVDLPRRYLDLVEQRQ